MPFLLIVLLFFICYYFRLSSLSKDEILSATLIDDSEFIEKFIDNYSLESSKLIHLPSSKQLTLPFSTGIATSSNIMSSLKVSLSSEIKMYLDMSELNIKELIEWLDRVSGEKIFEYAHK